MGMMGEFKKFAMRGNVLDMAVGIVIGVSFGRIVSSFVADIITPPIGLLVGGVDFSKLALVLKPATETGAAVTITYGVFLQAVFDFIVIAFAVFLVVRGINRFASRKEDAPAAPPPPSQEQLLLTEIRDLLKGRG